MVRPRGLARLAAGLVIVPFAALLAAACGGNDVVDSADTGADARLSDVSLQDELPPSGEAAPESGLPDTIRPDTGGPDVSNMDAGLRDADAARPDADAGLGDADAARPDADASPGDADAGLRDADGGVEAEASIDAPAGGGGPDLLASAGDFAVLAGSTVTLTPTPTIITGDVGVSPGTAIVTLPPGQPVGTVHAGDPVAAQAQSDLTAAYNALAAMPCLPANDRTGVDLGGTTLPPAVYCFDTSAGITGDLVLDAQLNPNAVWVFQVGSTLTTATVSTVTVINGGSPCNVYWQIGSSATLGTGTQFVGSIVALTSVTLVTGSTMLPGRALARNGAVTLDGNVISNAICP